MKQKWIWAIIIVEFLFLLCVLYLIGLLDLKTGITLAVAEMGVAIFVWWLNEQSERRKIERENENEARRVKREEEIKHKEYITMEMLLVVAPLKNRREDDNIFTYGMVGRGIPRPYVNEYYNFWDGIKQNKYLTTEELSSAIDEYLSHKETYFAAQPTVAYNDAKLKLYEAVDKRHEEIIKELKGFE